MATSGQYSDHANNLAIISAALRKIGRLGDQETLTDTDKRYLAALAALKLIVKEYAGFGMPLWAIDESTIAMSLFTTSAGVTIGLSGADVTQVAPLRILKIMRRDSIVSTDPYDAPMEYTSQDDWLDIPNRSGTGAPNEWCYYPASDTVVHTVLSRLKINPLPDTYWNTNGSLVVRYLRPLQDVGSSTLDVDYPVEWQRAIVYALAYDLAPEYGVDPSQRAALRNDRDYLLARAEAQGQEEGSYLIQPRTK